METKSREIHEIVCSIDSIGSISKTEFTKTLLELSEKIERTKLNAILSVISASKVDSMINGTVWFLNIRWNEFLRIYGKELNEVLDYFENKNPEYFKKVNKNEINIYQ